MNHTSTDRELDFTGLVDDAAIFPPGDAPMATAVREHFYHRDTWYAPLVGSFLCAEARLPELMAVLDNQSSQGPHHATLKLSLIAPAEKLATAVLLAVRDPRVDLVGVEVPPATCAPAELLDSIAAALTPSRDVPVAVEVPRSDHASTLINALAETPYRAKLRTGGTRAEAFPTETELAGLLALCARRNLPVKCTAGLHNAIRHRDPATHFEHHGFLNVLLAIDAADHGASTHDIAELLTVSARDDVLTALDQLDPPRFDRARTLFPAFGSCSVTEPLEDLLALDLLEAPNTPTST
jgi:hypothetical protein